MADPLTFATSFATLIQMVGMFLSGRKEVEKASYDEFIGWLRVHNHDELVNLIVENTVLAQSIATLLGQHQQELLNAIGRLDGLLVQIAANVEQFNPLAASIPATVPLPDQCVAILRWLVDGSSKGFIPLPIGDCLIAMSGEAANLDTPDPQFIEDDLKTMCEFGLLRQDYNRKGDSIYYLTRPGAAIVKQKPFKDG